MIGRAAAGKVEGIKNMVLYYLLSRDLKKIEGRQFTLRAQKNSQDSARIADVTALSMCYRRIEARIPGVVCEMVRSFLPGELAGLLDSAVHEARPDNSAIRSALERRETIPGVEIRKGMHLRVA